MDLLDAMHEDLVPLFTRLVGSDMIQPIREALADRDDAEGFVVDVLSRRWPHNRNVDTCSPPSP